MLKDWIYGKLSTTAAITAIVSTRIYPNVRQEITEMPALIYFINGITTNDTKGTPSTVDNWDVDITAFSESYAECDNLINLVRTALDRQSGTINSTTVDDVWIEGFENQPFDTNEFFAMTYNFKMRVKR